MARPCLGTAFQLPALEPGDGAGQRGLAQPGGEVEPAPLPRRLAPKPAGIRLPGGLPLLTSLAPQSVTVRKKRAVRSAGVSQPSQATAGAAGDAGARRGPSRLRD